MINLLLSEFKRLWARRMTRFFPSILVGLIGIGIAIAYFVISNDDAVSPDFLVDIAGGVGAQELFGPLGTLLPVMAFVIGASSIGADIRTGMLEQILTWEPRRLRFLGARTLSGVVAVALIAMIVVAVFVALIFLLTALTGSVDGVPGELWANVATGTVRSGLAASLFFVIGLGFTLLVNNSVGSIVGFVIYVFMIENFLVSAFLPRVAVYLPVTNADAFARGADVQRIEGSVFSDFELIDQHSYLVAGLVLTVWATLALVASAVIFKRRDVA